MKDELVTFETAKLAKEKGFESKCNGYYYHIEDEHNLITNSLLCAKNYNDPVITTERYSSAPTQSLLQRWLREEHNISVDITTDAFTNDTDNTYVYQCVVWEGVIDKEIMLSKINLSHEFYEDTYEQALETGLFEALKLIKP